MTLISWSIPPRTVGALFLAGCLVLTLAFRIWGRRKR